MKNFKISRSSLCVGTLNFNNNKLVYLALTFISNVLWILLDSRLTKMKNCYLLKAHEKFSQKKERLIYFYIESVNRLEKYCQLKYSFLFIGKFFGRFFSWSIKHQPTIIPTYKVIIANKMRKMKQINKFKKRWDSKRNIFWVMFKCMYTHNS